MANREIDGVIPIQLVQVSFNWKCGHAGTLQADIDTPPEDLRKSVEEEEARVCFNCEREEKQRFNLEAYSKIFGDRVKLKPPPDPIDSEWNSCDPNTGKSLI